MYEVITLIHTCYLNELSYGLHFKKWIFLLFILLAPHPQYMEVLRLGV